MKNAVEIYNSEQLYLSLGYKTPNFVLENIAQFDVEPVAIFWDKTLIIKDMKRVLTINFLLVCTPVLFLLLSCNKEEIGSDYRDRYLGNYFFAIKYSYPTFDSLHLTYWHDTNYTYNGRINKSTNSKNKIIVDWGNDTLAIVNNVVFTQKSEFTIDSEGILSYPEYYPGIGNTILFNPSYLENDTIIFSIGSGGLGYYVLWRVNGYRITN